jgi:hypothetical protein
MTAERGHPVRGLTWKRSKGPSTGGHAEGCVCAIAVGSSSETSPHRNIIVRRTLILGPPANRFPSVTRKPCAVRLLQQSVALQLLRRSECVSRYALASPSPLKVASQPLISRPTMLMNQNFTAPVATIVRTWRMPTDSEGTALSAHATNMTNLSNASLEVCIYLQCMWCLAPASAFVSA